MPAMNDWPFADPSDTLVFTTQPVLDGAPVRDVYHDQDGDWQILCGTTVAPEDGRLVHFAHLVEMTPSLASLADLPRGWSAGLCADPGHDEWHRRPTTLRARVRALLHRN
jgi:hypothetical protein